MSQQRDPEDPIEMDKWIRTYYGIENEDTDAFLVRKGFLADTPEALAKRLQMAYAWIDPQATPQTRPIIDQIKAILDDFERKTAVDIPPTWQPSQPLVMPQRDVPINLPPSLTEVDTLQLEKGQMLFEQAKALHRVHPVAQAQEKYRQAQSERATKPRKLDEAQCKRIAQLYWASHEAGSVYGVAKKLAGMYDVTPATIRATANKYKPDAIDE